MARGAGPNGTGDGVKETGSLVTMIATARRPLLARPTVLGAIVRAVDAAVEVGNGTSHEVTNLVSHNLCVHHLNFHVIVTITVIVSDYYRGNCSLLTDVGVT